MVGDLTGIRFQDTRRIFPDHAHVNMICIHAYTYIHACIHTYIHACMHAYMHAYIHTYMHTSIHAKVARRGTGKCVC